MAEHPEKQKWTDLAAKELRGREVDSLNWMTPEGIQVKPLYTAEDIEDVRSEVWVWGWIKRKIFGMR